MIIPPEAAAHADCFLVDGWPRVNRVATNEPSKTASANIPLISLDSVVQRLIDHRH